MKPGERSYLAMAAGAFAVTTAMATASPARAAEEPSPLSLRYLSMPVVLSVARPIEIRSVNRALRSAAIPELPVFYPSVGLSIAAVLQGGIVIEPLYRFTLGASDQVVLTTHHLAIDVGYAVIERKETFVYPFVGFGVGNAGMELTYTGVTEKPFEKVLEEPVGDALLASSALMVHAGVSMNLWGSGHGDFVGLRTGVLWSPLHTGWKRRSVNVIGGPPAPVSHAYVGVTLGFDTRPR